ncbi:hypothetical protein LCGC14_1356760 [marine sediment metagenome]|uniref:Uncharacterized protein n=1 Tax=marine sediment metagenome TaxID=412755 RepID=A0A0F9NBN1_9ZZZZ
MCTKRNHDGEPCIRPKNHTGLHLSQFSRKAWR